MSQMDGDLSAFENGKSMSRNMTLAAFENGKSMSRNMTLANDNIEVERNTSVSNVYNRAISSNLIGPT